MIYYIDNPAICQHKTCSKAQYAQYPARDAKKAQIDYKFNNLVYYQYDRKVYKYAINLDFIWNNNIP